MAKIWLVTGSSRGLGRSMVEAALRAGDSVLATARQPQTLDDLIARYPERLHTAALDVTDAAAAQEAVRLAVEVFGRLDVLVNNAGYGQLLPFEQMTAADFRAQIDTNFYGVVNLTRAALPVMRQQRSGHIIQISSIGGRIGTAGLTAYQAAKWAVNGLTEALDKEVRPLGIKVVTVEPGGIRTDWALQAVKDGAAILPDYAETVGAFHGMLSGFAGNEAGDPCRMAQVIVKLAHHDNPPVHLLLGSDAVLMAEQADIFRQAQDEAWRDISVATDHMPSLPDAARLAEADAVLRQEQFAALSSLARG
ncbi:MAG: rmlD substrate binding domain protein [Burkholderiaceae bacterium]|nr:rmlD substrate binding domain protein [Burkholderiaceae bacterium]